MEDENQATPGGPPGSAASGGPPAGSPAGVPGGWARADEPEPPAPPGPPHDGAPEPAPGAVAPGALVWWLALLAAFGIVSLLFDQQEAAGLTALAGLLIAAQAADLDRALGLLHTLTAWIVPLGGALSFVAFVALFRQPTVAPGVAHVGATLAAAAALAVLVASWPPVTARLARLLLRSREPSRLERTVARLVVIGLLFAPVGIAAHDPLVDLLGQSPTPLFDPSHAMGSIVGYALLALAGVGFLLRRGPDATRRRLGLEPIPPAQLVLLPLGVLALFGINGAAEAVQHRLFPGLWAADSRMTELIAGHLDARASLLLGLSAGLGEEITLRGALQPRLGIVLTALVFAALHVQYSWFGIGTVFLFGLVFGVIRKRTSTTMAIAVHALYDTLVVLSMRH